MAWRRWANVTGLAYREARRSPGGGPGVEPGRRRRPLVSGILIAIVAALGIGSRRFGHALPWFVSTYAGDTLWAVAVFLGLGLVSPRASTRTLGAWSLAISFLVELSQLYHAPWIDAVRRTTPGALALGSGFLASDLVCYSVGVTLAAGLETAIFRLGHRANSVPAPP